MGRFDPRWHDEHREAIIGSVLDRGHTIRHTLELAKRGELAPAPFDMPYSTAREYIKSERAKREVSTEKAAQIGDIDTALDQIQRRSMTLLDAWLRKLERSAKPQPTELERLLRGAQRLRELAGPTKPPAKPPSPDQGTKQDETFAPNIASMVEAARQQQRGSSTEQHNDTETADEQDSADTSTTHSTHYSDPTHGDEQAMRDQLEAGV